MHSEGQNRARLAVGIALSSALIVLAYLVGCDQDASNAPLPNSKSGSASRVEIGLDEFKREIRRAGLFSGGPEHFYEQVGRQTLAKSISLGLMPDEKVRDIGAGSLRVGWWLLHYIEPQNYYAVEPVRERIDTAADILGVDINIFYNDDWEFPNVEFDFVIARSIWTHTSKWMIAKMLSEFAENSSQKGKFLTSVNLAKSEREDYKGSEWVGKVEKSDAPGMVTHSMDWIRSECEKNGLGVRPVGNLYTQTWLLITRAE